MKIKVKLLIFLIIISTIVTAASGCNFLDNEVGKMKEALIGRQAIVQTYDEDSQIIDRIEGSSISISRDTKFDQTDEDGKTTKTSSVIDITIGGKQIVHVGSSLILYEKGLTNVFDEYSKKVSVKDFDRSIPFINEMMNDMTNYTTGKNRAILVRSQSGKPLATFVGNNVSYFSTEIPNSTGILIDGKYLFIYRCDYTIYELSLLK